MQRGGPIRLAGVVLYYRLASEVVSAISWRGVAKRQTVLALRRLSITGIRLCWGLIRTRQRITYM